MTQVVGAVKVSGRKEIEPLGLIPVLTFANVARNDLSEPRVSKQVTGEAVERGCPARDRRCKQNSIPSQHALCFAQGNQSIVGINQMIQRAQH